MRSALEIFDLATGWSQLLLTLWGGQGTINVPCWSPDGRSFAYICAMPGPDRVGPGGGAPGGSRRLAVLLLLAACAAAPAPQGFAVAVEVSLSPRAASQLAATGGGLIVLASYYGEPRQAGQGGAASQFASESAILPGAGAAQLSGAGLTREALDQLAGPPFVNINVSAELSSPDNLLACDYFDGPLARATAAPVTLRCALAEEKAGARAKS